jgi:hypothetical protein
MVAQDPRCRKIKGVAGRGLAQEPCWLSNAAAVRRRKNTRRGLAVDTPKPPADSLFPQTVGVDSGIAGLMIILSNIDVKTG